MANDEKIKVETKMERKITKGHQQGKYFHFNLAITLNLR